MYNNLSSNVWFLCASQMTVGVGGPRSRSDGYDNSINKVPSKLFPYKVSPILQKLLEKEILKSNDCTLPYIKDRLIQLFS